MSLGEHNPFLGTSVADTWWYRRSVPGARVQHMIDPCSLVALCGVQPPEWNWAPSGEKKLPDCKKCAKVSKQLSFEGAR